MSGTAAKLTWTAIILIIILTIGGIIAATGSGVRDPLRPVPLPRAAAHRPGAVAPP